MRIKEKPQMDKMDKTVRLLFETMQLKGLTSECAAPFIGCSGMQIRRWFKGDIPGPIYKKAIAEGIKKIEEAIPGDTLEGLVSWQPVKISDEEKALQEKLSIFFKDLMEKTTSEEKKLLFSDPGAFIAFQNFLYITRKYKIKLPKGIK